MGEHRGIKSIAERLWAKRTEQGLLLQRPARNELHAAETTRIVEGRDAAIRHVEDDMIVRRRLRARRPVQRKRRWWRTPP